MSGNTRRKNRLIVTLQLKNAEVYPGGTLQGTVIVQLLNRNKRQSTHPATQAPDTPLSTFDNDELDSRNSRPSLTRPRSSSVDSVATDISTISTATTATNLTATPSPTSYSTYTTSLYPCTPILTIIEKLSITVSGICMVKSTNRSHFPIHLQNEVNSQFNMLRGKENILGTALQLGLNNSSNSSNNNGVESSIQYDFEVQLPPVLPCSFHGHYIQYFYYCQVNAYVGNSNTGGSSINNSHNTAGPQSGNIANLHNSSSSISISHNNHHNNNRLNNSSSHGNVNHGGNESGVGDRLNTMNGNHSPRNKYKSGGYAHRAKCRVPFYVLPLSPTQQHNSTFSVYGNNNVGSLMSTTIPRRRHGSGSGNTTGNDKSGDQIEWSNKNYFYNVDRFNNKYSYLTLNTESCEVEVPRLMTPKDLQESMSIFKRKKQKSQINRSTRSTAINTMKNSDNNGGSNKNKRQKHMGASLSSLEINGHVDNSKSKSENKTNHDESQSRESKSNDFESQLSNITDEDVKSRQLSIDTGLIKVSKYPENDLLTQSHGIATKPINATDGTDATDATDANGNGNGNGNGNANGNATTALSMPVTPTINHVSSLPDSKGKNKNRGKGKSKGKNVQGVEMEKIQRSNSSHLLLGTPKSLNDNNKQSSMMSASSSSTSPETSSIEEEINANPRTNPKLSNLGTNTIDTNDDKLDNINSLAPLKIFQDNRSDDKNNKNTQFLEEEEEQNLKNMGRISTTSSNISTSRISSSGNENQLLSPHDISNKANSLNNNNDNSSNNNNNNSKQRFGFGRNSRKSSGLDSSIESNYFNDKDFLQTRYRISLEGNCIGILVMNDLVFGNGDCITGYLSLYTPAIVRVTLQHCENYGRITKIDTDNNNKTQNNNSNSNNNNSNKNKKNKSLSSQALYTHITDCCQHYECCWHCPSFSFDLKVPNNAYLTFESDLVASEWVLRFEFAVSKDMLKYGVINSKDNIPHQINNKGNKSNKNNKNNNNNNNNRHGKNNNSNNNNNNINQDNMERKEGYINESLNVWDICDENSKYLERTKYLYANGQYDEQDRLELEYKSVSKVLTWKLPIYIVHKAKPLRCVTRSNATLVKC